MGKRAQITVPKKRWKELCIELYTMDCEPEEFEIKAKEVMWKFINDIGLWQFVENNYFLYCERLIDCGDELNIIL